MCSIDPFQFRWLKGYIYSSYYYHHQIGSINLSPCYHIFPVVVCLICLLHHILSRIAYTFRENWDFVLIIIVQFMISANSLIRYGLQIVFVCLYITPSHYHHCANLSVDIEFMETVVNCATVVMSSFKKRVNWFKIKSWISNEYHATNNGNLITGIMWFHDVILWDIRYSSCFVKWSQHDDVMIWKRLWWITGPLWGDQKCGTSMFLCCNH